MTIDKQEIKALVLACEPARCADEAEESRRLSEFYSECGPETVLALLAEIERLDCCDKAYKEAWEKARGLQSEMDDVMAERDQLKAENEALRKQVADDERKLDALLAHCDDGECPTCAQIICPHGGAMHFHHDGCPTCAAHEETMAKEASHGK